MRGLEAASFVAGCGQVAEVGEGAAEEGGEEERSNEEAAAKARPGAESEREARGAGLVLEADLAGRGARVGLPRGKQRGATEGWARTSCVHGTEDSVRTMERQERRANRGGKEPRPRLRGRGGGAAGGDECR